MRASEPKLQVWLNVLRETFGGTGSMNRYVRMQQLQQCFLCTRSLLLKPYLSMAAAPVMSLEFYEFLASVDTEQVKDRPWIEAAVAHIMVSWAGAFSSTMRFVVHAGSSGKSKFYQRPL